jgi:hypothetical protein
VYVVGTATSVDAEKPHTPYRISVVMITRLMINLRDPKIHSLEGTVTTSHVGYVSTLVLYNTYPSMLATQTRSIPSPYVAWFVVLSWSHSNHVDDLIDVELVGLKETTREVTMTNSQRPP